MSRDSAAYFTFCAAVGIIESIDALTAAVREARNE
jgi:hypothetical protein